MDRNESKGQTQEESLRRAWLNVGHFLDIGHFLDVGHFCVRYSRIYILLIIILQRNIWYVLGPTINLLHALAHLILKTNL